MTSLRRALVLTFGSTYATSALNFLTSLYIARTLSPKEIGLFAIAAAVGSVATQMRGMGLSAYIVQEKELTLDRIRTASGVLFVASWSIGATMALSSSLIASYYEENGVKDLLRILSLGFLLVPISGINLNLLTRNLRFGIASGIEVASSAASSLTALTLAYLGFGYFSLAWASVAGIAATALLSIYYRDPGMPWIPNLKEWRRVLGFGIFVVSASLIGQIRGSVNELIVAKIAGPTQLAYLSRASSLAGFLAGLVSGGIQKVFFGYFGQEVRANREIGKAYLTIVSYSTAIAWPMLAVLGVMSESIILTLFGSQWIESIELTRFTAISAALNVPFWMFSSVLNAFGLAKTLMKYQIFLLFLGVANGLVFAPFGIYALAIASIPISLITGFLMWRIMQPLMRVSVREMLMAVRFSIFLTILCSFAAAFLVFFLRYINSQLIVMVVGGGVSILFWILSLFLFRHPLASELLKLFDRGR